MNQQSLLTGAIEVIAVSSELAQSAVTRISGCERCTASAVTPFEKLLDHVLMNRRGLVTYILGESAACPGCDAPILETTLVETIRTVHEPSPQVEMVFVDEATVVKAQALIFACENCEDGAGLSFDYLLDAVTKSDSS